MPSVEVDGRTIAYEAQGSGDPVVLVHGTGQSRQGWVAQVTALAERYRCIATDHRDVGESSYDEAPYAPADLAADVAAVLDRLGTGPAHLVGYSLGGAVVQELALLRPDLVRSLVLVATWARSDPWFQATMRSWQSLRRAHWEDDRAFLDALGPWLWSPVTYATPGLVDGLHTLIAAQDPAQRPDGWIRQCEADIAHDAAARLGRLRVPALVVCGADDITTPLRYARELAGLLPEAELVVVEGAGHGVIGERPAEVNALLERFLAAH
jgi:3-oxoadipate enol-lactonase